MQLKCTYDTVCACVCIMYTPSITEQQIHDLISVQVIIKKQEIWYWNSLWVFCGLKVYPALQYDEICVNGDTD